MSRFSITGRAVVAAALCAMAARPAVAQSHFDDCVSVTGSSANIIIPTAIDPTINDEPLETGDEIAVFTETGFCAGVAVWNGHNLSLTVWGDDSVTPEVDGFAPDEPFTFRVWDASEGNEGADFVVTYSSEQPFYRTQGTYRENAIYALASFVVTLDQDIPGAPDLLSPEDGAIEIPTSVRLEWAEAPDATSYSIQVSSKADFSTLLVDEENFSEPSFEVSTLKEDTEYFWRVRAANEAGVSPFSDAFSFFTVEPLLDENGPPVFETLPVSSVFVGERYEYDVIASDPDGDVVSLSVVQAPAWLSFETDGVLGVLSGTPTAGDVGGYTIVLRATDDRGAHKNQTFSITVKAVGSVNLPPEVVAPVPNQNASLGGAAVSVDLTSIFVDADGDPLEFYVSSSAPDVADALVDGTTIRVTARARGTVTIVVEARDSEGALASTSFDVLVSGNRSPFARPDAVTLKEDEPKLVDVRKNDEDPDGDELSISVIVSPTNGTATVSGEGVLYSPALDFFGQDSFVYQVSDAFGGTSAAIVYVEVQPVNDPPRFPIGDAILSPEDGALIIVDPASASPVQISWQAAIDPEGSSVVHHWELAQVQSFEEVLIRAELGAASETAVHHEELDEIIDQVGVALGESLTLYHRIVASDGKQTSTSGIRSVVLSRLDAVSSEGESPTRFALHQNYPNPFNPHTTVRYSLPRAGEVHLVLYDALGKQVRVVESGVRPAGTHIVEIDGTYLPSGLYVYRLHTADQTASRTAILLK